MRPIVHSAVVAGGFWLISLPAAGQQAGAAPSLTTAQRTVLQSIVSAVDAAGQSGDTPRIEWQTHLLRASDGSHYVAFSVVAPPGVTANRPVALYVRLATDRRGLADRQIERSAVAEWLAGQRVTPLPPERGIAFGDMPIYGPGAIASRAQAPQSLRLLEMERERARERREARERDRKAALEGEAVRVGRPLLPFEDFDLGATATLDSSGVPILRRSFTAGPGKYVLTVAWSDPTVKDGRTINIARREFTLPIASTTEFGLSSVIVADAVTLRDTPLVAEEQSRTPYSIGTMAIVPARDTVLTSDERLALVVQVINPRAAADGKPDVAVGFRVFRTTPAGEEHVGSLNPQTYNPTTLPPDFDVLKGHPIFAAVEIPLATFRRGAHRLRIMADDRLGGVSATTDVTFTVTASPAMLLREAPRLGRPFRREALLVSALLDALVSGLRPPRPSAALTRALDAARQRRFVELVRDDEVTSEEGAVRAALRALALYALGDTATAVAASLRPTLQVPAPPPALHILVGALRAIEGNDREAIDSWMTALEAGIDARALRPLMMDAHLRRGDGAGALPIAQAALAAEPNDPVLVRNLAAAYLASGNISDALALLDRSVHDPTDLEAQWLTLHALFAKLVQGPARESDAADRDRLKKLAQRYVDGKGPYSALAVEWANALASGG